MGNCLPKQGSEAAGAAEAPNAAEPTAAPAGNGQPSPGQVEQHKAYDKNDKTIPLGLRTDFGYKRDFLDHYELGKELGHGQFGITYLSTQKATGEQVAVKTIQKKTVRDKPGGMPAREWQG